MSNKGSVGSGDDEFECSECDYKCSSENNMIEHSAIHTCTITDSTIHSAYDELIGLGNDCSSESGAVLISEAEIKKENQVDISENNNLRNHVSVIKREIDSPDETYVAESNQENDYSNKKIKLEHIDMIQEFMAMPHFLSQTSQINEYDNISKYPNLHADTDKFTDDSKKSYDSRTLYNSNDPLYKNLGVDNLPLFMPKHIEIEVDSTGIYIPPGWKRQVLMNTRLLDGNITYECYYLTAEGTIIHNKKEAIKFLVKNPYPNVDAEELNFSVLEKKWYPFQSMLEHDINNKGVYIPVGWQRKLNVSTNSNPQIKYNIIYITPEGNKFKCKTEIYSYISDSCGEVDPEKKYIDPEKMDFSVKRPLSTAYNKIEVEVDNSELYIPEGWQRKLYQYTNGSLKGKHIVGYISSCGTYLFSKTQVHDFIKTSESAEKSLFLDVEKMNFSRIFFNPTKNSDGPRTYGCGRREIEIDNSGIYIPEGWQRKMYQYTNGGSKGTYFIGYISPSGKHIYCKSQVLVHNKKLESNGIAELLDYEKMNFSRSSHTKHLTKKGKHKRSDSTKVEIKVDNAGIYIPEGWQRKVYQYTSGKSKGTHRVVYISSNGKEFYGKSQALSYKNKLENEGITELIAVEKLNFSTSINSIRKEEGEQYK